MGGGGSETASLGSGEQGRCVACCDTRVGVPAFKVGNTIRQVFQACQRGIILWLSCLFHAKLKI